MRMRGKAELDHVQTGNRKLERMLSSVRAVSRDTWLVYINVVLYALCYQMQVPVLPYMTKSLAGGGEGEGVREYGTMQTIFGVVQFFGGLLAGPLVDVYGGRFMFLVSFGASALCYTLTASAGRMWVLHLSRVPTVLQHAVLCARAIVTEQTGPEARARMLGYLGLAYAVGMIVGPTLGGALSEHWLQLSAWGAAGGSLLSCFLIRHCMTSPAPAHAAHNLSDTVETIHKAAFRRLSVGDMRRVASLPGVPHLLTVKAAVGLASALFHSIFTLIGASKFGLSPQQNGMMFSYVGALTMASQGALIPWATAVYSEAAIVLGCTAAMAGAFAALAFARSEAELCALLITLIPPGALLTTVNTSQLTKAAPKDSGTIIAIDMSVGSLVQTLAPSLGTYILQVHGYTTVLLVSSTLCATLLVLLLVGVLKAAPPPGPQAGSPHPSI